MFTPTIPGPDPDTKIQKFKLPAHACDAHCHIFGPGAKLIRGTDWPHPNVKVMPNDGDLVDLIPLFAPEPELQYKILVRNPARLFEFNSKGAKPDPMRLACRVAHRSEIPTTESLHP